jgi:hypothetical protein
MLGKLWYLTLTCLVAGPLSAQTPEQIEANRQTCLSGRYPMLCHRDWLNAEEKAQARKAELAENLSLCLEAKYPLLCHHDWLTPEELELVRRAENRGEKAIPKAAEVIEIPFSEEPENSISRNRTRYVRTALRLRLTPSLTGEVLTTLPRGSQVNVGTCREGWCEVDYRSAAGYVAERYLSAERPPEISSAYERRSGRGYINSRGEWVPSPNWTEDGRPLLVQRHSAGMDRIASVDRAGGRVPIMEGWHGGSYRSGMLQGP